MKRLVYILRAMLLMCCLDSWGGSVLAQIDSTVSKVEDDVERLLEQVDPEETNGKAEQYSQFLQDLAAHPVNLNTAAMDDLLQIPSVNIKIAQAILTYRKERPFEQIHDLEKVPGIGAVSFSKIQPYVRVGSGLSKFSEQFLNPNYWTADPKYEVISRMQQVLQTEKGYERDDIDGGYLGSPVKYYHRFRITTPHASVHLSQEKDAGEPLNGVNDFDYNSGHIALSNNGWVKELILGDYSLNTGQGLVLWTGGSFGKGREVTGHVAKHERGLRPYTSSQESEYFRGVAATVGSKIKTTIFYSKRPRTASVIAADTIHFPSETGLHRTLNEIGRRNNTEQITYGGRIRINTAFGMLGLSSYQNEFNHYISKGKQPYQLYNFEGVKNSVSGIDYMGVLNNTLVFSELAQSRSGGLGWIAGLESSITYSTELSIAYRSYDRDFQSFFGEGFGERSSEPQNERGFYVGLKHEMGSHFTVSGYLDQFKFPAPPFGMLEDARGYDALGMLEYTHGKFLNAYFMYRVEEKEKDQEITGINGFEFVEQGRNKRQSFRMQVEYIINSQVRLRSRIEWAKAKGSGNNGGLGFLMYQDLRIHPTKKLRVDGRITFFDTDNYDSRLYQFEQDLLYVMSNSLLQDRGQRAYLVIKYEPASFFDLWFKYGISIYEHKKTVGSGLNEVQGNQRSTVGVQFRIKWP